MKKILIVILIVITLIITIIWTGKDILLTNFLKNTIKNSIRLESEANVHLSILANSLSVKDLKLFNPPEYPDRIMMYIPEIFIKFNIRDLLKKTICLEKVDLNLAELNVVRNSDGKVNIETLRIKTKKQPVKKTKVPSIKITSLNLKIDKATYSDYTKTPPEVKEFDVNLEEEIKNITNIEELVKIIIQRTLLKTAIGKLAEIDVDEIKKKAKDIVKEGLESPEKTEEAVEKLKDLFKEELEKVKSKGREE